MWRRSYTYLYDLETKTCTYSNIMTQTVSFGLVLPSSQQSKSATTPLPTIVHSTVVGRRSFGALKTTPCREVFHLVTRRRSSAA